MKVNEVITEAGVWQGIKNVGRGIGRAAGNAATGVVYGLDRLAGGSGDAGTRAQRAQRQEKSTKQNLAKIDKELPQQALAYFQTRMADQGMNLDDPTSFNPTAVRNEMREFALNFFAGGEEKDVKSYIVQTLPFEPLPNKIDRQTALNYFKEITKIRSNAAIWVAQNQEKLAAVEKKQTQEPAPGIAQSVSVVNSANPLILRYKNADFALTDDDRWVYFGSKKEASPEMTQFLNKQLSKL